MFKILRWTALTPRAAFPAPALLAARARAGAILGFTALVLALTSCGLSPVTPPLTAQQIFTNAAHSKMKDATVAVAGNLSTGSGSAATAIAITGSGQIVIKPTVASHLTLSVNLSGSTISGAVTVDEISIGDTAYTKTQLQIPGLPSTNSDLYTKSSVPLGSAASVIPQAAAGLKLAGEDTIRGDKCWHLTGTTSVNDQGTAVTGGSSGAASVTFDAWIRESDYYYVRVKLNTLPGLNLPLGATTTGNGGSASSAAAGIIIDLSNYDQGTIISPPPADQIQS